MSWMQSFKDRLQLMRSASCIELHNTYLRIFFKGGFRLHSAQPPMKLRHFTKPFGAAAFYE